MTWGHDKSKVESARLYAVMLHNAYIRLSSRNVVSVQIDTNRISSVFLYLLYPQYTVHVIIHNHTNHTILLHLLCSLLVEFLHPPKKNLRQVAPETIGLGGWDQGDHLQPTSTRMTCKTRLHMPEVPHNFATRKFTTKWTSSRLPKMAWGSVHLFSNTNF